MFIPVDLSQFLAYAALNKDRRLYTPLRDFAVRHLILKTVQIPTRGLSSGATGKVLLQMHRTTEALRLARAFGWVARYLETELIASKPS